MIPVASMFFTFTNTGKSRMSIKVQMPLNRDTDSFIVGAALWASDIEKKNTSMTDGTAPGLREIAEKAE